jgi:hypothetical protein
MDMLFVDGPVLGGRIPRPVACAGPVYTSLRGAMPKQEAVTRMLFVSKARKHLFSLSQVFGETLPDNAREEHTV